MKQKLQIFHDISMELQNTQLLKQIELLQKLHEAKGAHIPLIGQFSAGKSNLLNNLFGRKILPTMSSETTAFSTFISYGDREHVLLETKEGDHHEITLDALLQLSQRNLLKTKDLIEILHVSITEDEIESIHVYLQHPLLQSGLVFIDTPGLNTLIQTHENRTQGLLPQAHTIIYVLGKSLTDSDLTVIKQIHHLGIDLLFVRTKLDEIKQSEGESIEDVLQKDREVLNGILGESPTLFGISNDINFLIQPQWNERIEEVYNHLSFKMANQVEELKNKNLTIRLAIIAEQLKEELENRKHSLDELKKIDINILEEQAKELERQVKFLGQKMEKKFEQNRKLFADVKQQIDDDIQQVYEKSKRSFGNQITYVSSIDSLRKESKQVSETLIQSASMRTNQILQTYLDNFIARVAQESNEILADVAQSIEQNEMPSIKFNIDIPNVDDVLTDVAYVEEKLTMLQMSNTDEETIEKMKQMEQQRREIEGAIDEISQFKNEIEAERKMLGRYEPQYQLQQAGNAAELLGKIGKGLDWVTLFIPGKAVVKGATILTKGINSLKFISKSNNIAKSIANGVKVADTIQNTLKVTKNIQDTVRNHEITDKNPGILDMITAEFWFKKAGELFDGPPKHVEDVEYRAEFLKVEQELISKYENVKMQEIQTLQQLEIIKSREEQIKRELEIDERNRQQLQLELQREKDMLLRHAENKRVEIYRSELMNQFNESMDGLLVQQRDFITNFLSSFGEKVQSSISIRLQQEINVYRQQLEQAIGTKSVEEQKVKQLELELVEKIDFINSYMKDATLVMN